MAPVIGSRYYEFGRDVPAAPLRWDYHSSLVLYQFPAPSARLRATLGAPVAQMDRACASGAQGRGFESLRARQFFRVLFNDIQNYPSLRFEVAVEPKSEPDELSFQPAAKP